MKVCGPGSKFEWKGRAGGTHTHAHARALNTHMYHISCEECLAWDKVLVLEEKSHSKEPYWPVS